MQENQLNGWIFATHSLLSLLLTTSWFLNYQLISHFIGNSENGYILVFKFRRNGFLRLSQRLFNWMTLATWKVGGADQNRTCNFSFAKPAFIFCTPWIQIRIQAYILSCKADRPVQAFLATISRTAFFCWLWCASNQGGLDYMEPNMNFQMPAEGLEMLILVHRQY